MKLQEKKEKSFLLKSLTSSGKYVREADSLSYWVAVSCGAGVRAGAQVAGGQGLTPFDPLGLATPDRGARTLATPYPQALRELE